MKNLKFASDNFLARLKKGLTPKAEPTSKTQKSLISEDELSRRRQQEEMENRRVEPRFEDDFSGDLAMETGGRSPIKIENISARGFCAKSVKTLEIGETYTLHILWADQSMTVMGTIAWVDSKGRFGFHILETTPLWTDYVNIRATELQSKRAA